MVDTIDCFGYDKDGCEITSKVVYVKINNVDKNMFSNVVCADDLPDNAEIMTLDNLKSFVMLN